MHFTPMRAKLEKPQNVRMRLVLTYFPCPNTLVGVDEIQNCGFMTFFAHREQVHKVSVNDIWR